MKGTTMRKYLITRTKVSRSPLATGPGPAWKWLYDVHQDGRVVVKGSDMLRSVERMIRRDALEVGGSYYIEKQWANA